MPSFQLINLSQLDGFISACVFDADTGATMASTGTGAAQFDDMGPVICEVMQAHEAVPDYYGADPDRRAHEIIFTLGKQVHMLRPLAGDRSCLAHLVLERTAGNVGHARMQLGKL